MIEQCVASIDNLVMHSRTLNKHQGYSFNDTDASQLKKIQEDLSLGKALDALTLTLGDEVDDETAKEIQITLLA